MKEIKLREVIRKQLIKRLIEAPESFTSRVGSAVSSKLGGGRSELNRGLKKVGITSADFDSIKAKVSRDLSKASAETTDESVNEAVPGRVDMRMGQFTDEFKSKMKGKSAQQQQELVINLVSGLDIKGNDATFIAKLKKALK